MNSSQKKELYGEKNTVPLYYNFLKPKDIDDVNYIKLAYHSFYNADLQVKACNKPISKICLPINKLKK